MEAGHEELRAIISAVHRETWATINASQEETIGSRIAVSANQETMEGSQEELRATINESQEGMKAVISTIQYVQTVCKGCPGICWPVDPDLPWGNWHLYTRNMTSHPSNKDVGRRHAIGALNRTGSGSNWSVAWSGMNTVTVVVRVKLSGFDGTMSWTLFHSQL
jgi:hypothetical protein